MDRPSRFEHNRWVGDKRNQIVHDLDMKETRFAPPEAPAVGRMVDGLRELYAEDDTLLQHGMGMFEALARSFTPTESAAARAAARKPAGRRRRMK